MKAELNADSNIMNRVELAIYGVQAYNVIEGEEYNVIVKAERANNGRYYFVTREGIKLAWSQMTAEKVEFICGEMLEREAADKKAAADNLTTLKRVKKMWVNYRLLHLYLYDLADADGLTINIVTFGSINGDDAVLVTIKPDDNEPRTSENDYQTAQTYANRAAAALANQWGTDEDAAALALAEVADNPRAINEVTHGRLETIRTHARRAINCIANVLEIETAAAASLLCEVLKNWRANMMTTDEPTGDGEDNEPTGDGNSNDGATAENTTRRAADFIATTAAAAKKAARATAAALRRPLSWILTALFFCVTAGGAVVVLVIVANAVAAIVGNHIATALLVTFPVATACALAFEYLLILIFRKADRWNLIFNR